MRDSFISKLSRTFSSHLIDVLGELPAGSIHLTKPEKHLIRAFIKIIRDICLKFLYLLLYPKLLPLPCNPSTKNPFTKSPKNLID